MYAQTIYWRDFTLDFREICWTFGREWDWADFPECHKKFVMFGSSVPMLWTAKKSNGTVLQEADTTLAFKY